MNWRRLIYSIVIPSIAGFFFGIIISVGKLTNRNFWVYIVVVTIATFLSNIGKEEEEKIFSTMHMGTLSLGRAYLFILIMKELAGRFSWLLVAKLVGFVMLISTDIYLAKTIINDKQQI